MNFLHHLLEKQRPLFEKGGKFERFYYVFEAAETFMFTPPSTTPARGTQIRDAIDLKRMMMTVVVAMLPCLIYGMWNAGHQHYLAIGQEADFMTKFMLGLKHTLPIILVAYAAGGLVETVFAVMRKHPINEGFLVTGMLIPLVMPITIPLWQVAVATIFAVLVAKEVFGGTGMNILNVALTARAFLYFAYPTDISGSVWTLLDGASTVDGYSGATALAIIAETSTAQGSGFTPGAAVAALNGTSWAPGLFSFENLFMGAIPGSIGETSTLMCLIGAAILIATGVGSWKIIVSVFAGAYLTGLLVNAVAVNAYMDLPAHYHLVIGGLAFGAVFMATDPVSAAHTETGKWIYGFFIGFFTVIIRVFNPAYPEGIMLAILLMNVFAPLIDYYVVQANKNRRLSRATV
ncbi:NADH:ubiquinone reductase (Na(+)-transporting) subunit B [Rhodoflexus caldus]|uniref:NADH:ubiquinone reductase (Na(+)-transporting) subunit B n=1 Tax=Rhodoflexus caldus TaxID=2891236 RepID=UPI00202AC024|nr:NADH:ubiquinone reductase (Na(+)-transporting) subunit B [Rhodoflexus caldus]